MKKLFDEKPLLSFLIGAALIATIGVIIFLFTKNDPSDPLSITGLQALQQEGFSFWAGAIGISLVAGIAGFFALRYFSKEDSAQFGSFWIAFAILMAVAWGKGCTNKADNGVSSSKGRPVKIEKDTTQRVPAEDLLPKK